MRKDPEIVPTSIIKNSSYCTVYALKRGRMKMGAHRNPVLLHCNCLKVRPHNSKWVERNVKIAA
jgi:hypothetical protein